MGEYEPHDSRNVTLKQERAPGEPPRTGPRESEARQQAAETELEQDERGDDAEATIEQEQGQEALGESAREASMDEDADELDAGFERRPGDRND